MIGQAQRACSPLSLSAANATTDCPTITRAEFIRALKRELPDAIDDIRKAGVGPVDMQQSVIGPGMGVFYALCKVLEDDDSAMTVKTALSLINRVWEEIENELDTNFDAETQVALAWFATYGFDAKPSGELITLANAKNIPLEALCSLRASSRTCRARPASPRAPNCPTIGACSATKAADRLGMRAAHRARAQRCGGWRRGRGRLGREMGPKAADARALAYRLYEIAPQKAGRQRRWSTTNSRRNGRSSKILRSNGTRQRALDRQLRRAPLL